MSFPHTKVKCPKKIGPKIHYVKQNFARTHLVRISQILMNRWRVLKNTSASILHWILHDRIPKQTSPVYTKIYLFVKRFFGFPDTSRFILPRSQLAPRERSSPTPPHQIHIWDSWTLRCVANRGREHQQWHLSASTKTKKIEEFFIFPIGHVGRMDQVFASELFHVF